MYELNDIFNQLLGETKVLNLDIIYPKYNILFDTYDKSLKVLILLRNHIVLKHIEKDDPSTEEALKNYDEFIKLFEEFLVNNKNNYNIEDFKKKDITLEEEEDSDANDANDINESDIETEKKDYMDSDILEIIKYRKKELNIDISVLKNMMRYDTLIEINNRININGNNILNILEEPKIIDILELIKQICEYEFNIKREIIDKYLKYLCEIYLNKENILNDLNINKKVYNDIFNNLKYLFKISNWYFKIELES